MEQKVKLIFSTRVSGNGEISRSNKRFRENVTISDTMSPKYGKALKVYQAKQELITLFN